MVLDSAVAAAFPRHGPIALAHIPPPRISLIPRSAGLRKISPLPSSNLASASRRKPRHFVTCQQHQETLTVAGEVTDKTWKELVLDSEVPVLVDFWAPWCGPCRMIAPLVDDLAREYAGRVRCLKINTDENPNTATEYAVRSIPTVIIFKQGIKKDTIIGAVPKAALVTAIEKCFS